MDHLPRVNQLEQVARERAAARAAAREQAEEERQRDETRRAARAARVAAFEYSDASDDNQDGPHVARQRQGPRRNTAPLLFSGFLNDNKTAIRSASLATALVSILQNADGHLDGIVGALGHGKRTSWIRDNYKTFFQPDGPLSTYKCPAQRRFASFLKEAEDLAKSHYYQDHSNEETGAGNENVPNWTRLFFRLFEAQQNQRTSNNRTLAARSRMTSIVRSVVGAQAPLGYDGNQPASLRNETSANNASNYRQQVIGEVSVGLARTNTEDDEDLVGPGGEDGFDTNQEEAANGMLLCCFLIIRCFASN